MGFKNAAAPRGVKFNQKGVPFTGIVVSVDEEVKMTFTENNRPNGPQYDENGNVVLGTSIVVAIPDEKGAPTTELGKIRVGDSIFTDRGRPIPGVETTSGLKVAIQDGLTAVGSDDLEVGDTITITYVDDDEPTGEAVNGAKVYAVEVVKAAK